MPAAIPRYVVASNRRGITSSDEAINHLERRPDTVEAWIRASDGRPLWVRIDQARIAAHNLHSFDSIL